MTEIIGDIRASIHTDYVYLDNDERRRFAQGNNLTFNHPVRELIWAAQLTNRIPEVLQVSVSRNGDLVGRSYINIQLPGIGATHSQSGTCARESVIYKIIQSEKNQCMISYNTIKPKCKYWQCDGCNNAAIYSHISRWFQSHNTCPTCRKAYNFASDGITYYIDAKEQVKK
jgi:hypothetical protein